MVCWHEYEPHVEFVWFPRDRPDRWRVTVAFHHGSARWLWHVDDAAGALLADGSAATREGAQTAAEGWVQHG